MLLINTLVSREGLSNPSNSTAIINLLAIMSRTKSNKMTQSALATLLGTTRQNIHNHIRAGKAPKNLDDVEGWRAHLAAVGRIGTASRELRYQSARERLAILTEILHEKRRHNRLEDAECLDAKTVNLFLKNLVNLMLAELHKSGKDLPRRLAGKAEIEILEVCRHREAAITDAIKRAMKGKSK